MIIDEAEQRFGLRFEEYGLSPQEGARLARWFAKYDANEDRRIEASELRKLVAEVDRPISQEEAERALALLDKNNNGVIEVRALACWIGLKTDMGTMRTRRRIE